MTPGPGPGAAAAAARFPDLAGKVAIVTGGSKGIGRATCRLLADNGCRVAVVARGRAELDAVVEELRASGAEAIGAHRRRGRRRRPGTGSP